jgi:hypothetical protein
MFRGTEVLRIIPDREGRGGTKFGYHSFQQQPINDTRDIKNVYVWQDSWRGDTYPTFTVEGALYIDSYPYNLTATPTVDVLALHGYSKFSLTDPAAGPTTEILGHNVGIGSPSVGYIWNYCTGIQLEFEPPASYTTSYKVCTASADSPAVFCNVGNRVFIARGTGEGVIYDSSHGDPAFDSTGTPRSYSIGIGAPTAAPVVTSSDVVKSADIYLRKNSYYISNPDPNSALNTAATANAGGGGVTNPANDILTLRGDGITLSGANAVNIGAQTTVFAVGGRKIDLANGSDIATFSSAPPALSAWAGLKLTINGIDFVMLQFGNHLQTGDDQTLTTNQVKLDHRYNAGKIPDTPEAEGGFDPAFDIVDADFYVSGVRWTVYKNNATKVWPGGTTNNSTIVNGLLLDSGGRLTWADTPPSYAYAWYDPETGHVSNISPVFSPDATSETDVGIQVNVDQGSISYPPSTTIAPLIGGWKRWTHILFFRTLMAGGSTLYPIGSLDPYVIDGDGNQVVNPEWKGLPNSTITTIPPAATGNYWYDSARDSDLLISGALRAPQFTNGKPRIVQNGEEQIIHPAHMAYWDGRLWLAGPQDPAAIHYSCDRVQCPFGIPEESFADTNVLRIPAEDGCIRGMKLVGEQILITTERWAYTIAGNNESNYRLIRVSTRMAGVGDYQMAEFTPEVEGQTALVCYLGTDSKVYAMPLGGQAVWISKEIQTVLDSAGLSLRVAYNKCRVHAILTGGRRLLLVYIQTTTTTGRTFYYDFDTKTWSEHTLRTVAGTSGTGYRTAWASIYTTTDNGAEIYAQADVPVAPYTTQTVRLWRWFQPTPPGSVQMPSGYVRTFPLTLDGKKTRKKIEFVRGYVSNPALIVPGNLIGWYCTVKVDSGRLTLNGRFSNEFDDVYRTMGVGTVPVDGTNVAELVATGPSLLAQVGASDAPIVGYTFDVQVEFPNPANDIYRLYAIDIGYSTLSEGQVDI